MQESEGQIMTYSTEDYLAHYQIKGAKHGVRRFQNYDGSLTPEGRERYGVGEARPKSSADAKNSGKKQGVVKSLVEKHKANKEAKKAQSEAEAHENKMKYLRKHPTQTYKHRAELSTDDINRLVNEINLDNKLKDIRDAEIDRGWRKVQRFANNANTISNLLNSGKNIYNLAAEVHNTLIDSGKITGSKKLKIGEKPETKEDRSVYENLIKNASWDEIVKRQNEFTNQELSSANKRKATLKQLGLV